MVNDTAVERLWPIISNARALSINAAWDGEAGRLLKKAPGPDAPTVVRFGAGCEAATDFAFPGWAVWSKRLGGGKLAVLAINIGNTSLASGELAVSLAELNDAAGAGGESAPAASSYAAAEVWRGGSLGSVTSEQPWVVGPLLPRASVFATFEPVKSASEPSSKTDDSFDVNVGSPALATVRFP